LVIAAVAVEPVGDLYGGMPDPAADDFRSMPRSRQMVV
jgi:hypothetical protein